MRYLRWIAVAFSRRQLPLFGRGDALHPSGLSLGGQMDQTGYEINPRYSIDAVARTDAELDKRRRRIAVTQQRRERESNISRLRRRKRA